jgi:hypothetical protein
MTALSPVEQLDKNRYHQEPRVGSGGSPFAHFAGARYPHPVMPGKTNNRSIVDEVKTIQLSRQGTRRHPFSENCDHQ